MTHELPKQNNNKNKIKCIFDKNYIEQILSMILTDNPEYLKTKINKPDKYCLKIKVLTEEIIRIEIDNPIMISDNKNTYLIERAKAFDKYYKQALENIKKINSYIEKK
mgnify:FL=1